MRSIVVLIAATVIIVLLAYLAQPAHAASFVLNPPADALVSAANPNNNYCLAGALEVSPAGEPQGEFHSLIKFDFATGKATFDATYGAGTWSVTGATLALVGANPNNPIFNANAVGQFSVSWIPNDSWVEGTGTPMAPTTNGVTFNTYPSFLGGEESLGTFASPGTNSGNDAFAFSLPSAFTNEILAGVVSSMHMDPTDSTVSYLSTSGNFVGVASRPLLTINAVPEPSSLALCAIAIMQVMREEAMRLLALLLALSLCHVGHAAQVVRVAVIGGMNETGFWEGVAQRFQEETGIEVQTIASGPKEGIDKVFRHGGIDLITMHASDTIINLVADGYALDPQPWTRNDMVIVGPPEDPAKVKGMTDAAAAVKKIVESGSAFVVHASLGAQEVLRGLTDDAQIELKPEATTILLEDRQRRVLHIAAEKKAYTLIGRIPFLTGKIPNEGLVALVSGDDRLRRPFVVAIANPAKIKGAQESAARKLVAFLRSPKTQEWIGTFGKGKYDDRSLFFPVDVADPAMK